jgi:hypothetical protein
MREIGGPVVEIWAGQSLGKEEEEVGGQHIKETWWGFQSWHGTLYRVYNDRPGIRDTYFPFPRMQVRLQAGGRGGWIMDILNRPLGASKGTVY